MRKRILIVVIVLLAALGAYLLFSDRAGKNANDQIIVSGNIELTEVNIAFKTSGRLIERTVDEGDVRKKGTADRAAGPRSTAGAAGSGNRRAAVRKLPIGAGRNCAGLAEGKSGG